MRHPLSTNPTGTPRRCPTRRIRVRLPLATVEELDHLAALHHAHPPADPAADPRRRTRQRHAAATRRARTRRAAAHPCATHPHPLDRARCPTGRRMSATAPHPHAARRAVHIEISDEDKAALWAMSLDERIAAMWAGAAHPRPTPGMDARPPRPDPQPRRRIRLAGDVHPRVGRSRRPAPQQRRASAAKEPSPCRRMTPTTSTAPTFAASTPRSASPSPAGPRARRRRPLLRRPRSPRPQRPRPVMQRQPHSRRLALPRVRRQRRPLRRRHPPRPHQPLRDRPHDLPPPHPTPGSRRHTSADKGSSAAPTCAHERNQLRSPRSPSGKPTCIAGMKRSTATRH